MKGQNTKRKVLITVLCLLLATLCTIGIVLIAKRTQDQHLDEVQKEKVEELENKKGEYDEHTIVLCDTSLSEANMLAEKFNARLRISQDGKFATLTLSEEYTILDVFSSRANRKYIESMSPDFYARTSDTVVDDENDSHDRLPMRPNATVSDPDYEQQTYLDYLNMSNVWSYTKGAGITVAVIDTGIDTDHPEFAGRISEYSYNASEDKIVKDYIAPGGGYDWSLIEDEVGHGTAVTGVIAATMNDDGVVGIAPQVNIIVIKCECTPDGRFVRTSDLVFGLYYAIERDVSVVNMSFGGAVNIYENALRLAVDSDIICIAAAGNDASTQPVYPAADPNVIGVGALDADSWELAEYSNYGENVNIVAPGTTYTTLKDGKYGVMNGTSLATPTVAGAVALFMARNQYARFETVQELLYASATDLGDPGEDWYYGYGALDVSAFILEGRGTVTFNMLTDELENTTQVFIRNHTLQDLPEPERLYAVFDGWYYDIDCTDEVNWYRDVWTSDLTLYASWVNEDDGVPYTYVELDDGTIEIRSYTGKRRYITIPEYIDGKLVTSIGNFAFEGQSRLRSVKLPSGLKQIRMAAFRNCSNLLSVEIPEGVTYIGEAAFMNNVRLATVAFAGNSALARIDGFAFAGCSKLERIELPGMLASVDGSAFFGATSLRRIDVRQGNTSFRSVNSVLFNNTAATLVAYPAGLRDPYTIPDSVTAIGPYAFGYARFKEVDLNYVQNIGAYGFAYSQLESIVIPDSVTVMGEGAFSCNFYLKSLTLGNGLTQISINAFENCFELLSVEIPANVQMIGGKAFDSTGIRTLTFAQGSQLKSIGASAFALTTRLESVRFPASLSVIGEQGFYYSSLSQVTFEEGSSLQTIGQEAFENAALCTISFPDTLRQIGDHAFENTGLTEATLPASLEYLGEGAFASCHSLENIFVDDANPYYIDVDGVVYDPTKTVLIEYPAGNTRNSYTILSTVTKIGNSAFYGSWNLTTVYMSDGLITVGEYGFYDCRNITGYMLPQSLTYIERYAFANNKNLGDSLFIPNSVYQISNYAFAFDYNLLNINFTENATIPRLSYACFAYTGLYSFRVPASVSTMSQYVFEGCNNLTAITFAANSKLESISAYMFIGCTDLQSLKFENGSKLTSIQAHGLEGMTKLTSVDWGNAKLTNIDNYAFRYCERLTTLPVPDGVTYIGRYAFYGCKALERLNLPASMDYIGENAFYFAENLNLYFAADTLPPYLMQNWDNGIRSYHVGVKNVVETDEWIYAELNSGKTSIVEYKGDATEIDLTTLGFGEIASIGGYAFYGKSITSITLPETLTSIHQYAFAYTKLENVSVPASVTFIGRYAFVKCAMEDVTFAMDAQLTTIEQYAFAYCDNLTAIRIPASVTNMGRYAFTKSALTTVDLSEVTLTELPEGAFMATKLTSVVLPDSLTLIDHNAFRDCKDLQSVTFGTGELQLMSNVFYNTGLTSLYIPANLTYIGEYSFVGLQDLTAFTVDPDHPKYTAIDGLLYSKDGRKLIAAPAGKTGEITLPRSLEILGFGAFENSKLTKINFHPESNILTFGYRCFYNAAITELNVPKTVVSFDYYAFAMCKDLETVTVAADNKLNGIYEGAFYGCNKLKNIVIPDSIVEISDFAFYGCTGLAGLPVSESSQIKGIYGYAFAYCGFTELDLPGSLADIGEYAFKGNRFKSLTIPDENKYELIIGIGAFEDCNSLEEITVPFIGASFEDDKITWFGYIFGAGGYKANNTYVPENLKHITVTDGISTLYPYAFYELRNMERIDIPNSVTGLYLYAFFNCPARYEHKTPVTLYRMDGHGNSELVTTATEYYFGKGIIGVALGDSVTSIGERAFYGCSNLTSITIPDSVTSIGRNAFYGCNELKAVCINDISAWCNISFGSNPLSYVHNLYLNGELVTDLVIPDSVTSISNTAFSGCSNLTSVTFGENSQLMSIGYSSFFECSNLISVAMPDSLTSIGKQAFSGCSSLTSVTFGENNQLMNIGDSVFYDCSSLTSVTIPNSVTNIGNNAFSGCSSLTM